MNYIDINRIEKFSKIEKTLTLIASVLNEYNINWGLGGSLLLYIHGIETTVADIDIVIDESDIYKVEKIVKKYDHIEKLKSSIYLTERFYSITIDGIDIDLMLGFKIQTSNGIYSYPKGSKLVYETVLLNNTNINLCSLDDWLQAYVAMERTSKIELINRFNNK